LTELGAKLTNLTSVNEGIQPKAAGKDLRQGHLGSVEIDFRLPYVITDTRIEGTASFVTGGAVSFLYSLDAGRSWRLGGEVRQSGRFGPIGIGRPNSYEYPAGSTSGQYGFRLRIVLRGRQKRSATTLKALRVTNTTMLNFYSRPWLEVGPNKVSVTCGNPSALTKAPLEVTWRWLEDWKLAKSYTQRAQDAGAATTIHVNGKKRPKMRSVTIACPAR
jgi:hypothetical protein